MGVIWALTESYSRASRERGHAACVKRNAELRLSLWKRRAVFYNCARHERAGSRLSRLERCQRRNVTTAASPDRRSADYKVALIKHCKLTVVITYLCQSGWY